jgi:hypothetical protein
LKKRLAALFVGAASAGLLAWASTGAPVKAATCTQYRPGTSAGYYGPTVGANGVSVQPYASGNPTSGAPSGTSGYVGANIALGSGNSGYIEANGDATQPQNGYVEAVGTSTAGSGGIQIGAAAIQSGDPTC